MLNFTMFYVLFCLGGDRLLKLLATLIGFSVICGVMFLDPDAVPSGDAPSCARIT